MIISESIINSVLDDLNTEGLYHDKLSDLFTSQQALVTFLESEGFAILNDEERDLLWYLTVVVFESVQKSGSSIPDFDIKTIEVVEEKNYGKLESEHMKFSEMADLMFKDYVEEDMLAFIEDTVIPDEDEFPSPVGRKVIFMTMKTVIDVVCSAN